MTDLGRAIRAAADEIERGRRLPERLVREMAAAGLFRLCVPKRFGGGEADVTALIESIEAIAHADGAAGWCAMIAATTGVSAAYLEPETAREIYGNADAVTGGVFQPRGFAEVVDGGYRVNGRWPFGSGCEHCEWLTGGSIVVEGGKPRMLPTGMPDVRMMFFPRAEVGIHDTWNVSGLRGTGSHDIEVVDAFVPAARSFSMLSDRPREPGPLYAFPIFGLLAVGVAAVALGIGRAAIDEFTRLAAEKTPTSGRRRLAERGVVQAEAAEATASLGSGRAYLREAAREAWQRAVDGGAIDVADRARIRLAATSATQSAVRAVDRVYEAAGGTSIYSASPLQRQFRDVHVITQHMIVARPTYELVGRLLFGLETDVSML